VDLVRDALRTREVRVEHVARLSDAVLAVGATAFDLILLDLSLPDASGLDALVTLRREVDAVPVVVLTAVASEDIAADALACGAEDYLLKQELNSRSLWRTVRQAKVRHEVHERDKELLREQGSRRAAEIANRMKDEFLVTLSHELRTPLNAILGWIQVMAQRDAAACGASHPAGPIAPLDAIARNANTLKRLVGDMLDLSYIASGKLQLAIEVVAFSQLVETAVQDASAAAESTGVALRTSIEPGHVVNADSDRLRQVMHNLLANAIKFTPPGGAVSVTVRSIDGNQVEVVVSDTGVGLSPESISQLFQRFSQPSALKTGLGIGLSICKDIVAMHGGSVSATSDGLGCGTSFTMILPADPSPDEWIDRRVSGQERRHMN
jgi:signal transduction histidine kinase